MQRGHWVCLTGIGLMLTRIDTVDAIGLLIYFVGCFMCDPNRGTSTATDWDKRE